MNKNELFISVIIPTYNCKNYLVHSLPHIKKSDYPHFEIIVVDNKSTDGSLEFSKQYADTIVTLNDQWTPGKARNRGAKVSRGSVLFFLDADVLITSDTISQVAKTFMEDTEITALFGSYDDKPFSENFLSQYKNLLHHFIHQNADIEARTFWSGCGAIKKEIFFEMDGFPENYLSPSIEDVELGYKLSENGKKIRLLKELQVTHLKKWDFFSLLKSDILCRAIPWTKLAFKKGLPYDLNFKLSHRISGIIAFMLFLCFILMWRYSFLLLPTIGLAGILFYLNRELYRFFWEKRGIKFTVPAIFLHWFYFLYSSVTFGLFFVSSLFKSR